MGRCITMDAARRVAQRFVGYGVRSIHHAVAEASASIPRLLQCSLGRLLDCSTVDHATSKSCTPVAVVHASQPAVRPQTPTSALGSLQDTRGLANDGWRMAASEAVTSTSPVASGEITSLELNAKANETRQVRNPTARRWSSTAASTPAQAI